jgi:anti-anti-sigma factor
MDITVSHEQGRVPVSVLHVADDIDSSNYEKLDQVAEQEIQAGAKYILVDLTEVGFISSAGFRSFTKIFKKLRSLAANDNDDEMPKGTLNSGVSKSPYLKLYNPCKLVTETMKIAGFDLLLEVHDNLQAAIASF